VYQKKFDRILNHSRSL